MTKNALLVGMLATAAVLVLAIFMFASDAVVAGCGRAGC
jgi:hypothetical protein